MGRLDKYIQELSRELNLEKPLNPSSSGSYFLPLEDTIRIQISENLSSIVFLAGIGSCPSLKREAFLQEVMEANLFGQGTHGGVLSLSEEGKITLTHSIPGETSYDSFSSELEDFITTVDFWKDEIFSYQ